jgi:hypothetical protein
MPFGRSLTSCPAQRQAANKKIGHPLLLCVVSPGQSAGLTIPRRIPSGPTSQQRRGLLKSSRRAKKSRCSSTGR